MGQGVAARQLRLLIDGRLDPGRIAVNSYVLHVRQGASACYLNRPCEREAAHGHAVHGLCGIWAMQDMGRVVHGPCGTWAVWFIRYAIHGPCGTWAMRYMIHAVHGLRCTWAIRYQHHVAGVQDACKTCSTALMKYVRWRAQV
eukprot:364955-Chlamydomonas_euryale.AAC.37